MKNKSDIIIKEDPGLLAEEAAKLFSEAARDRIATKGLFSIAVSGGSTPRKMHRLLSHEPYFSEIPWEKTHIFWVDERSVPYDHMHSNYGAAAEDLLREVPIPEYNVHPMPVEGSAEAGSKEYEKEITSFFGLEKGGIPRFDMIILGIGKDGHTASLFPEHKMLDEKTRFVICVTGGNPDVSRITLTFPIMNNAMEVLFLVSGEEKAEVLKAVLEDRQADFPAQRIKPVNGKLKWLVDRNAASMLSKM